MSETAIAVKDSQSSALAPMSVQDLLSQVALVQEVMKSVMQDGQHYGKIPGCGDKPSLYKPGAEKLGFVFRLAPEFIVDERSFENGHREYRVTCNLKTIGGGVFIGSGLGIGSTMEAKYRFRTGAGELTNVLVPKSYWDNRSNPAVAKKILNEAAHAAGLEGDAWGTKKNDAGAWVLTTHGERVEHDNPADYYNTVLKMAKKRAQVDAILTATAASDIFTQDLEDIKANAEVYKGAENAKPVEPADSADAGLQRSTTVPRGTQPSTTRPAPPAGTEYADEALAAGKPTPFAGDWREFKVPFGKAAGAKLGELPYKNLRWWIENYEPKPFKGRPPKQSDLDFRAALDAAQASIESEAQVQHDALETERELVESNRAPRHMANAGTSDFQHDQYDDGLSREIGDEDVPF